MPSCSRWRVMPQTRTHLPQRSRQQNHLRHHNLDPQNRQVAKEPLKSLDEVESPGEARMEKCTLNYAFVLVPQRIGGLVTGN